MKSVKNLKFLLGNAEIEMLELLLAQLINCLSLFLGTDKKKKAISFDYEDTK